MPAADSDVNRRGAKLLPVLFWCGVGLAPLAGLLLLVGSGDTPLRVAAALAMLAVVLIGLSVALRPDAGAVKLEMEETLLDEIDMLREDMRDDIATAARATHQGFGERLLALQQTVDNLRNELQLVRDSADGGRAGFPHQSPGHQSPPPPPTDAPPAVAQATVTPPVSAPARPVYGSSAVPDQRRGSVSRSGTVSGGRAHVPAGIYQHTETVQVTTRSSTYVDRHADDPDRPPNPRGYREDDREPGRRGADRRGGEAEPMDDYRSYSAPPARRRRRAAEPAEPWTEQWASERYGRRSHPDRPEAEAEVEAWPTREPERRSRRSRSDYPGGETGRGGRRRAPESEPESDWSVQPSAELSQHPYPAARAGDRWAEARSDDRGRELRMGERRASMHSDEAGTELRFEDRWASVRREGDGPDRSDREPDYRRRALPASSDEPSWNETWDEPARQPDRAPRAGRRRRREDQDDLGYPPTGSPSIGYDIADERWR